MKGMRPATQFLMCWLAAASVASAQTIDLQTATGRRTVDGHVAGAAVGSWLHIGDLTGDYWTKELILGAPDEASGRGTVRLYIGTQRVAGDTTTATADVVITGLSAGDRFGAAGDAGYVTNREVVLVNGTPSGATPPRDLLVGAPSALGGRGIVYVFAGPFSRSTPVTVANAVARITGAPGDNLGSQVESADLNGDGFREVILPVPSRGIVYAVDVHNAASSSIDLSVAVPGTVLTGLGTNIAVAAGDVTGDGLIDLAVGTPDVQLARGAVYLLLSRSRVLPASITLPSGADGQITGEEPGDQFGASLWVADIDDDRDYAADLLVGAPGADGPANTRTNAGAVYVVWGRADLGSTLRTGLVLHGAAAGHRLGTLVTSGNITRRNPLDVVALAPGANGGSGEIFLYYGRHVFEFPSSGVADLATTASRRVLSDESAGTIRAVRAWEATGEGAEEIVVGVPDAATTAGARAGRLYIALSPRLELSTTTATMRVMQCVPGVQEIEIRNPSVIAIPWQLYDPPSWAEIQPSTGTTVVGSPARVRLVVRTSGMTPGTYSQQVIVRSAGPDVGHAVALTVQLTVDPPAPTARSAHVDFNGDGCGDVVTFHAPTGRWRTADGTVMQLGQAGDIAVPGDYNGDWIADFAVYRPSDSSWRFASGAIVTWGEVGDIPVPADYDGDGQIDIAVYRPATSTWIGQSFGTIPWGQIGDVPVAGDYDGDGRAELAVFQRATAVWNIRGVGAFRHGAAGDLPVPADFDADGKTDVAIFRRATGTWHIRDQDPVQWGRPHSVPIAQDMDRDGRADLVALDRATGFAHVYYPITGVSQQIVLGSSGERPASAAASVLMATRSQSDFDGDGAADSAIWQGPTGWWGILMGATRISRRWGGEWVGDVPVVADYDGDGRSDIAVWRPGTGMWYVLQSKTGYMDHFALQWGGSGDIPVAADFDGDRRADLAVWRPGTGIWYVRTSGSGFTTFFAVQWGGGWVDDRPVVGDYDGDGRADIAVWRPNGGMWYIKTSSSAYADYFAVQWGGGSAGDRPAPADYDGDGRTDIAVWRSAPGLWYVKTSSDGYQTYTVRQWGSSSVGDVPVVADYDGDGRCDHAVWRPSSGTWYVLQSRTENASHSASVWGNARYGDRPAVAASSVP